MGIFLFFVLDKGEFYLVRDKEFFHVGSLDIPFFIELAPLKVVRSSQFSTLPSAIGSATLVSNETAGPVIINLSSETTTEQLTLDKEFLAKPDVMCLSGMYDDRWLSLKSTFEVFEGDEITFKLWLSDASAISSKFCTVCQLGVSDEPVRILLQRGKLTERSLDISKLEGKPILFELEMSEPQPTSEDDPRQDLGCILSSVLIDGRETNESSIATIVNWQGDVIK